jgi:hypothetical protein
MLRAWATDEYSSNFEKIQKNGIDRSTHPYVFLYHAVIICFLLSRNGTFLASPGSEVKFGVVLSYFHGINCK